MWSASGRWRGCCASWATAAGHAKTREGSSHRDRDAQFAHINDTVKGALEARQPVISVDTKKKELVGDFKNGGRELRPERSAVPVPVHDFKDPELGKAIPYGMRELPKPPCRFCSPATERSIHVMYARVVRFTDVDPDHLAGRLDEVEAREGPPVDIPAKGVQILHDADQRTAVVIQLFETADDMSTAEAALDTMDPADTPGTRASIDRCEIKAELGPG